MSRTRQVSSYVLLGLTLASLLGVLVSASFVEPHFREDQEGQRQWQMVRDTSSAEDEAEFDSPIVHELSHSDRERRLQLQHGDADEDESEFDVSAEQSLLERMEASSPLAEDRAAAAERSARRQAVAAKKKAAAAARTRAQRRPAAPAAPALMETHATAHHTERAATLSAREFAHAHAKARYNAWAHAHQQHDAASSMPGHFRFRALGEEQGEHDEDQEGAMAMPMMFESQSHARLDDEDEDEDEDEERDSEEEGEDEEADEDDEEAFDRETEMLEMRRRTEHYSPRMRFARSHARGPLPKDKNGRLYYAKAQRGQRIRRMIRRGDMLYRYAPELMNQVLDPGRITPPGITPSFAMAMNGPLGPLTSPPFTASSPAPGGAKPNTAGPAVNTASPGVPPNPPPPPPQEEGKEGNKEIKPHQLLDKAMAKMDQQLRLANVPDQAQAYPHLYRGWDNYMFPTRNRPLPPRFYPYPSHMSRYAPVASFPPPKQLFDHPLAPQPVLQRMQPLFHNPSRSGTYGRGLQPVPAPFTAFAGAGVPSPSPYMQPIGFTKGSVMGPKNHAVFPNHPVPLEKWYSRFEKPAEAPKMTAAPAGGAKGEEKEEEF